MYMWLYGNLFTYSNKYEYHSIEAMYVIYIIIIYLNINDTYIYEMNAEPCSLKIMYEKISNYSVLCLSPFFLSSKYERRNKRRKLCIFKFLSFARQLDNYIKLTNHYVDNNMWREWHNRIRGMCVKRVGIIKPIYTYFDCIKNELDKNGFYHEHSEAPRI